MNNYFRINNENNWDKIKNAKWIWGGENPRPVNQYRLFRKEIMLDAKSIEAEIIIYAESRYKLYINNEFIQVGPTACQPEKRLFDFYDIGKFLIKGNNCIGIEVHCAGLMNGQWTMVNPALIATVIIDSGHNNIYTDTTWKTINSRAWVPNTQICPYAKGFHEYYDMTKCETGWKCPGFNDSVWDNALEIPFFSYTFESKCYENYTGYPTLINHMPEKLIRFGTVSGIVTENMKQKAFDLYKWSRNRWRRQMGQWNIGFDEPLPKNEPIPEPIAELVAFEYDMNTEPVIEKNINKNNGLPIRIITPEYGDPYLIFDFGIVRCGLLSFDIESISDGIVDIAWDDRIDEHGNINPYRSAPNCDRVIFKGGRSKWDGFFERGLRFLKIVFRKFDRDVTLFNISVKETLTTAPLERMAKFESSDKLLEKIWNAAFYTVRSYMNGCAAGDPVREKCHWLGDDSMAMRMAFYCFGDWKTWRRGLELTAQSQNSNGSFPVVSPGHFEDTNMVTGSCGWVINVNDYYKHTGDTQFAKKMINHIDRHINYELRFADHSGLLYETPGRRFLSWADGNARPPYKKGEIWAKKERKSWGDFFDPPTRGFNAIINIYWLWNLREASNLAYALGNINLSQHYTKIFNTAFTRFNDLFWDERVKLYRDNVSFDHEGKINEPTFCESTLFYLIKSGLINQDEALNMHVRIMDENFICCRASGGLELSSVPVMLLQKGKAKEALEIYRELWGAPIIGGATTCGEEFFRCSGNSDCHIHGAAPSRDFLEHIVGIKILSPFWRKVLLQPPLNISQLPDINSTVPTYYGDINVKILTENEQTKYIYDIPKECKCFVKFGKDDMISSPNIGELIL